MKKVLLILFLCAFWVTFSQAEVRTWNSAKSSVEGEFVELTEAGTIVRIRKTNGKIVRIPLDKLVREDQEYVKIRRDGGSPSAAGSAAEVAEESTLEAGTRKVFTVDGIDYAFRWCPAGEFEMGSTEGESDEKPVHKVKLTKGFWLMETEVTVGMFESFVRSTGYESQGNTPYGWTGSRWEQDTKYSWRNPGFSQGTSQPVTCISWNDAQAFCQWLGKQTGQRVELPTEAQWEYACRAGTTGAYAGELDEMGWYCDNSGSKTHAVGQKKPNAWGLYDMHGNVWEWCSDWYGVDYYSESPTSDPTGPTSGSYRVNRGGCWSNSARVCRSAVRDGNLPVLRDYYLGLRATLVPVPAD